MQLVLTSAVIIVISVLGGAVFLNNRKKPVNIVFSLFVLSVVGWTISNYLADHVTNYSGALFWVRASFAFTGLICATLFLFSLLFAAAGVRLAGLLPAVIGLSGLAMFFLAFTPYIVRTVQLKSWGANTVNGPFFWVFLVYFGLTVTGAIGRLLYQYARVKGQSRRQIQYLFFGVSLSVFFGAILNLILPLITGTTELAKFGPFGTIFLIFFTSVAIIKHRLLDIRLLVLKSVGYTISVALLFAGYTLVTYLAFQELRLAVPRAVINVGVLFILVFTFNPLKTFIEVYTDRLFFKNRYSFNELLTELTNITKKYNRTINTLTMRTLTTLVEEMRVTKAAFILALSSQIAQVNSVGYKQEQRSAWGRLMGLAMEQPHPILAEDLPDDTEEKAIMRERDVEVLVPIRTEQSTFAALALSEKKSGDPYSAEDINLLGLIGPQIALALENAKSFVDRGQRLAELQSINKMFRHIEHFLDLDKLLQEIVDEAVAVTKADAGSLMLTHDQGRTLSLKTARNLEKNVSLNSRVKAGEGIAGTVAWSHRPLMISDCQGRDCRLYENMGDISCAISVPMIVEEKLIGVLNVHRRKRSSEFNEENLNIMNAFAAQAAEAIVKAGHYRQIKKLSLENDRQFHEFVKALARTVDAKDPYTYGHSEEVAGLCLDIARAMALSEQHTRSIEIGSQLHDMGKIGIPEAILNKKTGLTGEEMATVRRHPEIAADILKDTESLSEIRDLILYHHEHWDGSGYPAGLSGEDIPLGSRILAVADAYDAMCSRRAYREPMRHEDAVAEIERHAGVQFDPEIVKVFLGVVGRKRLRLVGGSAKTVPAGAKAWITRRNKKAA